MHVSEELSGFSPPKLVNILVFEFRILLGSPDIGGSRHLCIRLSTFRLVEIQDTSASAFSVNCRMIRSSIRNSSSSENNRRIQQQQNPCQNCIPQNSENTEARPVLKLPGASFSQHGP